MKTTFILCSLLVTATFATAQERVSLEDAQKGARLLTQTAGKISDAPLKLEVDLEKPDGLKANEVRILVIPDQKLNGEALAKTGKTVTPLGQLWMHAIAPAKEGKVISNDRLRFVTVTKDDKEFKVLLFFLGLQKSDKGEMELVVYGKDKEPLLRLPLEKSATQQQLPIELQGRKEGEGTGVLTLNILGKYKAELPVTKPAE